MLSIKKLILFEVSILLLIFIVYMTLIPSIKLSCLVNNPCSNAFQCDNCTNETCECLYIDYNGMNQHVTCERIEEK